MSIGNDMVHNVQYFSQVGSYKTRTLFVALCTYVEGSVFVT